MKLIPNFRSRLTDYSTIALATATFLQGAWLVMPQSLRATLPALTGDWVQWATLVVTTLGTGGKFLVQGKP